jgi:DNA-binding transcriptional regulator YhcF (GntR family)
MEKSRMTRTKIEKGQERHQTMHALTADNLRGIVKEANSLGIKREDIVSLLEERGQYVLIYYYGGEV